MSTPTPQTEATPFQAEIQQVLDILIHSLYSEPEIFLRELLSNASDALSRYKFTSLTADNVQNPEAELGIWLEGDEEAQTIIIRDTGIGMNEQEMHVSLGTIAKSGAREFIAALKERGEEASDVIGQFGVGFYSVFMVADEVTVISRSYRPEDQAVQWVSEGKGTYTITPAERDTRGTEIRIKLKEEHKAFAEQYRISSVVKKHSNFVPFPIYIQQEDDEGNAAFEKVNEQTALWRQTPREVKDEDYQNFYQTLTFDYSGSPLMRLHLNTDVPIELYALLFIPSQRNWRMFRSEDDFGLRLHVRKVLIDERFKDFLPPYLRFVQGVVDTEDLPLNVSRQMVQASPMIQKISDVLIKRIANELGKLAKKDSDAYNKLWREFGSYLKEGVGSDFQHRDKWIPLLRFTTSKSQHEDDLSSLEAYVERMKESQEVIYYVTGENFGVVKKSPHLDYFRKHDLEVLLMTDPIDSYMMIGLNEFEGKSFQSIEDADLKLPEEESSAQIEGAEAEGLNEEAFISLQQRVKTVLEGRVEDVHDSKLLEDSPVRLVNPSGSSADSGYHRIQMLMGQEAEVPKKILELNRKNALIQGLSQTLEQTPESPLIDLLILQLFESALLAEGIHPNPAEMLPRIEQIMSASVGTSP